jgi:uncharacterized protein YbbC (DUF1343 family)
MNVNGKDDIPYIMENTNVPNHQSDIKTTINRTKHIAWHGFGKSKPFKLLGLQSLSRTQAEKRNMSFMSFLEFKTHPSFAQCRTQDTCAKVVGGDVSVLKPT